MFVTPLVVTEGYQRAWRLWHELQFWGNTDSFVVPHGFETDFASIPRVLRWLILPYGRYTKSAVLHDYLYFTKEVSRLDADGLFDKAMKSDGVPDWQRHLLYYGVRLFGWIKWQR